MKFNIIFIFLSYFRYILIFYILLSFFYHILISNICTGVYKYVFKKQNALTRFILKYQIAVILTGSFILGAGTGKIVTRIEKLPKHVPSIASSSINSSSSAISSESTNWGLGFDEEGKRPTGNASIEQLKKYNAYYAQNTDSKILYLTFDAGYENGNTPAILDALKKHNCPATFFVVGNFIADNPKLIQRMISEGHTVGNHTMTHPDMSKISSVQAFQNELSSVEQLYKNITDQDMPKLYRPPRGIYSTENLTMAKTSDTQLFLGACLCRLDSDHPTFKRRSL